MFETAPTVRAEGARPNSQKIITKDRDAFLMDFENSCLQDWPGLNFPKGPKRHEDPEWRKLLLSNVYPYHSDVDFLEYAEWCEQGGGDDFFHEAALW